MNALAGGLRMATRELMYREALREAIDEEMGRDPTVFIIGDVLMPDAAGSATNTSTEPTGPACSAVPAEGAGSFAGMAQDPAATAASNNPLLSTLVTAVGAAGLGDIGRHFPDTDERWKDADSLELLRSVRAMLRTEGYEITNIDATVACEEPKLAPFRDEMRTRLAEAAGVVANAVNVKFTTGERMGFVGRGEGIAALAIATVA